MSRKIKFRVWNGRTKQWIHSPSQEVNLFGECILLGEFMSVGLDELNDCIALQYIGINDTKGMEIYEGDIIELGDGSRGVVKFDSGSFYHTAKTTISGQLYWNIVCGNIFDNPELLPKTTE